MENTMLDVDKGVLPGDYQNLKFFVFIVFVNTNLSLVVPGFKINKKLPNFLHDCT